MPGTHSAIQYHSEHRNTFPCYATGESLSVLHLFIGGKKMKKLFLVALLLSLILVVPIPTMARAAVSVSIGLPPPVVFAAPPEMIVLPETYVYVVPDVDVDIFFYNGWWWRPWEGRWYRSQNYNSGWGYYNSVPSFYAGIPSGWRNDYRDHRWKGHQWNYQRIPQQQVQQNWKGWQMSGHWEKQQGWGVQGLKPRTRSQQPSREARPGQSRPHLKEAKQEQAQQHQEAGPQSRKTAKPQRKEAGKPQHQEAARPQHQATGPQSRGGQPQ